MGKKGDNYYPFDLCCCESAERSINIGLQYQLE